MKLLVSLFAFAQLLVAQPAVNNNEENSQQENENYEDENQVQEESEPKKRKKKKSKKKNKKKTENQENSNENLNDGSNLNQIFTNVEKGSETALDSPEEPVNVLPEESVNQIPIPVKTNIPEDTGPSVETIVTPNNFSGVPFFPGSRRQLSSGEAPINYKVESGDTLFDICDQLIDEPDYWPKLWALNPEIKNPHFIYPNMTLSFYPGDDSTPPYLQVISEDDVIPIERDGIEKEIVKVDTGSLLQETLSADEIQIIDDPSILPTDPDFSIESFGEMANVDRTQVTLPAFFEIEEIEEIGTVVGGSRGAIHALVGERVIIDVFDGSSDGAAFTIVRPSGEIEDEVYGEDVGYRYEFVAHVKPKPAITEEDYLQVEIIEARMGVRPDDLVIPYRATRRTYSARTKSVNGQDPDATIIGFAHPGQTIGGQGQIVYLNKSLPAGQVFGVYQRIDQRANEHFHLGLPEVTEMVGSIQIIDTVGPSSVGVVMYSPLDVRVGDLLGSG